MEKGPRHGLRESEGIFHLGKRDEIHLLCTFQAVFSAKLASKRKRFGSKLRLNPSFLFLATTLNPWSCKCSIIT